jgi:hypothetical protein
MACRLTELVIDCAHPAALASFWAAVLQAETIADPYGFVQVTAASGPLLTFVQVPEAKSVKNRLHIDLNPSGCTQAEEAERLTRLGATPVDVGQGDADWIVFADPEGNEFCLLAPTVAA